MVKRQYNPFNPNSVVLPNLFAGRSSQVLDISRKLSQLKHKMPASFFIYGERGIGKTALAKLIKSISDSKIKQLYDLNLLSSYYSVEEGQDIGSVLQASINALTDQMDSNLIHFGVGYRIYKHWGFGNRWFGLFKFIMRSK